MTISVLMSTTYTAGEARGVGLLVAAGALSLISVVALLIIMAISAYRSKGSQDDHVFVRTHVAAYFVSLLICDLMQGIGSLVNIAWINNKGVTNNSLCVAQGAIKQTGNVGTALWSLVIAIHTFCLLFYRAQIRDWVCWSPCHQGEGTLLWDIGSLVLDDEWIPSRAIRT